MTDPIIDRLDQIKGRADKATPGPWTPIWEEGDDWWMIYGAPYYDGVRYRFCPEVAIVEGDSSWSDDARFISAARTDVPQMEQALREVLDLHGPIHALDYGAQVRGGRLTHVCTGCGQDNGNWQYWPCPTVQAIAVALGVETEGEEL